jgi:hypothetical protein
MFEYLCVYFPRRSHLLNACWNPSFNNACLVFNIESSKSFKVIKILTPYSCGLTFNSIVWLHSRGWIYWLDTYHLFIYEKNYMNYVKDLWWWSPLCWLKRVGVVKSIVLGHALGDATQILHHAWCVNVLEVLELCFMKPFPSQSWSFNGWFIPFILSRFGWNKIG